MKHTKTDQRIATLETCCEHSIHLATTRYMMRRLSTFAMAAGDTRYMSRKLGTLAVESVRVVCMVDARWTTEVETRY